MSPLVRSASAALLAALLLALPALPAEAQGKISFAFRADATTALQNPERGFWRFAADNFATATDEGLRDIRDNGMTVGYAITRLDEFRDRPLPAELLQQLDAAFARARAAGVKVILRFAYNYPASSSDYAAAQDAPIEVVLGHISQLGPVLAANADTIVAVQAGFIGAWGEGHSSSNGLDTPDAKRRIRDALLADFPAAVPLQWRYPPDVMAWPAEKRGRIGIHNDCFLSSPTDVGTYDENPRLMKSQRKFVATLSETTYFSGETCDAEPARIRKRCSDILTEGARYHLSALGRDYYTAFHKAWAAQGCLATVENRMGYRLRLVSAQIDPARGTATAVVANDGWARPVLARRLVISAYSGPVKVAEGTFGPGSLADIGAGKTATLTATLPGQKADRWCLSAPDPSPRLAADPRFSIRFANAALGGQAWDAGLGAFCFR